MVVPLGKWNLNNPHSADEMSRYVLQYCGTIEQACKLSFEAKNDNKTHVPHAFVGIFDFEGFSFSDAASVKCTFIYLSLFNLNELLL